MTTREAFGVVDGAIARATNLPVSYVAINEALRTLQGALEKLDALEAVAASEKAEVEDSQEKGVTI